MIGNDYGSTEYCCDRGGLTKDFLFCLLEQDFIDKTKSISNNCVFNNYLSYLLCNDLTQLHVGIPIFDLLLTNRFITRAFESIEAISAQEKRLQGKKCQG